MEKILSIDIGGSSLKVGLVNFDGEILLKEEYKHNFQNINELKSDIIKLYNKYKKDYNMTKLAISSPGYVDSNEKKIHGISALEFLHGNEWVKELEKKLKIKIEIENDANCALLAEIWKGNAKSYKNVVCIVIGTGIGGAISLGGKVINGKDFSTGEFGSQLIYDETLKKYEIVSKVLSTKALVDEANKIIEVKDGKDFFLKKDTNKELSVLFDNYCQKFALFLYNINTSLNPDLILIGGGVSSRKEIITKIMEKYEVLRLTTDLNPIKLNLKKCLFGNDANLLGAVKNYIIQNENKH